MKKYSFVSILAALCLVAACTDQPDIVIQPGNEMVLTARTEQPASKTVVTNETHVYWEPGDEIAIFSGDKSGKFTTDLSAASATATFKGSLGGDPDETLWAVYPYSDKATFDGESITTVLPSVQTARAGSFGKDMNLAVAQTTGSTLQFYNVGGGVRFSVKEEGIKKVMFEGLNGEILAGTIKIGFENSMPVVKEVTSGSQFLTLLPPEGETFQKDTWYYIVALPAALEKGYKLRFYKTDDYARRVSENAVTISRSLYGSVAGADEGLAYESTTKSAPETKGEWEESIEMTNQIVTDMREVLKQDGALLTTSTEELIQTILQIEGVKEAVMNSSETGISVQQSDGIWVNYLLDASETMNEPDNLSSLYSESYPTTFMSYPMTKASSISNYHFTDEDFYLNSKKKALFLLPFQHQHNNQGNIQIMIDNLMAMGFREENIDVFVDRLASIKYFMGEFLSNYDFIYIRTHGGLGYNIWGKPNLTMLSTYIPYSKELADSFVDNGILNKNEIVVCSIDDDEDGEDNAYLAMSPDFLHDATFNNSCVILKACHSAELCEENNPGSLVWRFLKAGAGIVSGFNKTNMGSEEWNIIATIVLMSKGISFQDATSIVKYSLTSLQYNESAYRDAHEGNPIKYPESKYPWFIFKDNYVYFERPGSEKPYYLVSPPNPVLNPVTSADFSCKFSWNCSLQPEMIDGGWGIGWYYYYEKALHSEYYTVTYDVYVDDAKLPDWAVQEEKAQASWSILDVGEHSWYVVANVAIRGNVYPLASYQSEVDTFTVKPATYETPSLIDLGMPSGVKWASFNLGATKPEEYGRYFAWGETTPKSNYDWSNYKWCKGSNTTITKYCWNGSYGYNGFVDNKRQLDLSDDAANAQLKGEFRTPTCDDWKELLEHTTHQWTNNYNGTGVAGLVCKSTVSGYTTKQIFLPAARYGSCGDYMTSSAVNTNPDGFDVVYFTENQLYGANYDNKCSAGSREEGYTIRPVYGQPVTPSVVHSVTVSPASYNFGSVVAGQQSDSKKFSITNDGSEDIEYWVESCPDGFAYPDGMKNKVRGKVSANSTLERFWVRFVPTQAKNYSGTVVLGTTDSEYPYLYISVSGKGTN